MPEQTQAGSRKAGPIDIAADLQYQLDLIGERFPAARLLVDLARDAGMEAIKKLMAELRHTGNQLQRSERKREKLNDRLLEVLHDLATGPVLFPPPPGREPVFTAEVLARFRQFREEDFPALAERLHAAAERGEALHYQAILVEEIPIKGCCIFAEFLVRHAQDDPPRAPDEEFLSSLRLHIAGNVNQSLAREMSFQMTPEVGKHIDRLIGQTLNWLLDLLATEPAVRLFVPRPSERFDTARHQRSSGRDAHSERVVLTVLFPGLYNPRTPQTVIEKAIVHTGRANLSPEAPLPPAEAG